MLIRETVDKGSFNEKARLPYQLRLDDFAIAMQDVYDFFFDVNKLLLERGLHRLDDMLRPAAMSGMISDMLTASMAKHARSLVENKHFNGHPDLIVQGRYANNSVKAGTDGVEIKSTRKRGGAVDTHGAREQDMCVFVYVTDHETEPALIGGRCDLWKCISGTWSKTIFEKIRVAILALARQHSIAQEFRSYVPTGSILLRSRALSCGIARRAIATYCTSFSSPILS
jgi:hypothetical protein